MFSYFTIASANKLLPLVVEKFKEVLKQKENVMKIEHQCESVVSTTSGFEEYIKIKKRLNSAIAKFYQAIEDLENTGAVLKGIEEGLLDFPSKRFDKEIWLCWKFGEKEIKFWHEKDIGFNGRKPISVSNESLV